LKNLYEILTKIQHPERKRLLKNAIHGKYQAGQRIGHVHDRINNTNFARIVSAIHAVAQSSNRVEFNSSCCHLFVNEFNKWDRNKVQNSRAEKIENVPNFFEGCWELVERNEWCSKLGELNLNNPSVLKQLSNIVKKLR